MFLGKIKTDGFDIQQIRKPKIGEFAKVHTIKTDGLGNPLNQPKDKQPPREWVLMLQQELKKARIFAIVSTIPEKNVCENTGI